MKELQRVLVVEDEPDIIEVAKLALETVGQLEVHSAISGHEALEIVESAAPDMILLDVMMPGMDGPTALAALKANRNTRDIPVVFISAKVQPVEIESYLKAGVVAVIAKPFDPMTLADQVKEVWEKHQTALENPA